MILREVRKLGLEKINQKGLDPYVVKMILEEIFDLSYSQILPYLDNDLDPSKESRFFTILDEYLKNERPIQYILGYAYFYGSKFIVNKNVLIPRYETEEVLEFALKLTSKENYKSLLDVGVGSGNIVISAKINNPSLKAYGVDISNEALDVARENKKILNADVELFQSDLFSKVIERGIKVDLVISNPPYISYDSKDIEKIVKENEPHLALFAPDEGLLLYKKMLESAKEVINKNGSLVFEIGFDQKEKLENYIKDNYPELKYKTYKDINGNNRILHIKFPE